MCKLETIYLNLVPRSNLLNKFPGDWAAIILGHSPSLDRPTFAANSAASLARRRGGIGCQPSLYVSDVSKHARRDETLRAEAREIRDLGEVTRTKEAGHTFADERCDIVDTSNAFAIIPAFTWMGHGHQYSMSARSQNTPAWVDLFLSVSGTHTSFSALCNCCADQG